MSQPEFDFVQWLTDTNAWQSRAFGDGPRVQGIIDHFKKELREIEADPGDLVEYADLIFLAIDGARRHVENYTPEALADALQAKLAANSARTWPDWRTADPDRAIEHVREPKPDLRGQLIAILDGLHEEADQLLATRDPIRLATMYATALDTLEETVRSQDHDSRG